MAGEPGQTGQGGVSIVEAPPPAPPPAPTSSIQVSDMPAPAEPKPAPRKGSAMDRMRQDLAKKARSASGSDEPAPPPPEPSPSEPTAPSSPKAEPTPGSEEPPEPSIMEPGESPQSKPAAEAKGGKQNPWKIVEQYKSRVSELEKQMADSKTSGLAEQQRKEYIEQIEKLTKKQDELQNELRFVDFSKSEEFQSKYQKPYEAALQRAMTELAEIPVIDPASGQNRQATIEDLWGLLSMSLPKARQAAAQYFGDFADDVMAHRKEIKSLLDAQNTVLQEARTKGQEREKQKAEIQQKQQTEIRDFVTKTYQEAQSQVAQDKIHGRYISPADGDEQGNQRLEKGFAFADEAFRQNPLDPSLTPEKRAQAVRMHVALRNRAAAYGKLVDMVTRLESEKAAIQKELEEMKSSTPTTGGGAPKTPAGPQSARDSVFGALRAKARPA